MQSCQSMFTRTAQTLPPQTHSKRRGEIKGLHFVPCPRCCCCCWCAAPWWHKQHCTRYSRIKGGCCGYVNGCLAYDGVNCRFQGFYFIFIFDVIYQTSIMVPSHSHFKSTMTITINRTTFRHHAAATSLYAHVPRRTRPFWTARWHTAPSRTRSQ